MPVKFRARKYSDSEEEEEEEEEEVERELEPLLRTRDGKKRRKSVSMSNQSVLRTGAVMFIIVVIIWYILNFASILTRDTHKSIQETRTAMNARV